MRPEAGDADIVEEFLWSSGMIGVSSWDQEDDWMNEQVRDAIAEF